MWQRGNHLLSNGKTADAIVFRNNFHPARSGGTYHPVVRFLTDDNEWITQELSIGYSPAIKEGTKLQVIYDPKHPGNVEINSSIQLEILPRVFVVLGIGGLLFAIPEYLRIIDLIPD